MPAGFWVHRYRRKRNKNPSIDFSQLFWFHYQVWRFEDNDKYDWLLLWGHSESNHVDCQKCDVLSPRKGSRWTNHSITATNHHTSELK